MLDHRRSRRSTRRACAKSSASRRTRFPTGSPWSATRRTAIRGCPAGARARLQLSSRAMRRSRRSPPPRRAGTSACAAPIGSQPRSRSVVARPCCTTGSLPCAKMCPGANRSTSSRGSGQPRRSDCRRRCASSAPAQPSSTSSPPHRCPRSELFALAGEADAVVPERFARLDSAPRQHSIVLTGLDHLRLIFHPAALDEVGELLSAGVVSRRLERQAPRTRMSRRVPGWAPPTGFLGAPR